MENELLKVIVNLSNTLEYFRAENEKLAKKYFNEKFYITNLVIFNFFL